MGVLAAKHLWQEPYLEAGMELESRLASLGGKSGAERGRLRKALLREKGRKMHSCPLPTFAPGRPHPHKATLLLIWQRTQPTQGSFQQLAGASGQRLGENQLGSNHEAPSLKAKPKANRKSTLGGDMHVRSPDQQVSVFLIDFK